jgi:hypothetical protein
MADPLSLASVGATILTEGIKFLYGQASEVLKRRRERRDAEKAGQPAAETVVSANEPPAAVFAGASGPLTIHLDRVDDKIAGQLVDFSGFLSNYANESLDVDPGDGELVAAVDAVRKLLEAIYEQRMTFKGEVRPPSGPEIDAELYAEEVAGDAAVVRARLVKNGRLKLRADVGTIQKDSTFSVLVADTIGEDGSEPKPVRPTSDAPGG